MHLVHVRHDIVFAGGLNLATVKEAIHWKNVSSSISQVFNVYNYVDLMIYQRAYDTKITLFCWKELSFELGQETWEIKFNPFKCKILCLSTNKYLCNLRLKINFSYIAQTINISLSVQFLKKTNYGPYIL